MNMNQMLLEAALEDDSRLLPIDTVLNLLGDGYDISTFDSRIDGFQVVDIDALYNEMELNDL